MISKEVSACVKVAACICGKDGVISEAEERSMFEVLTKRFPNVGSEDFDRVLSEFFDSDHQIEHYLSSVMDSDLRSFTLELAEVSASSDGLEIRENIALRKAYEVWGLEHDASHD